MKLNNLKIETLLKTGFAILFLFVIVIGFISYLHSGEMHQQTEDIYCHPLQERRSIGELTATVYAIRTDAFIPKPIDKHQFFNTINSTLYGK